MHYQSKVCNAMFCAVKKIMLNYILYINLTKAELGWETGSGNTGNKYDTEESVVHDAAQVHVIRRQNGADSKTAAGSRMRQNCCQRQARRRTQLNATLVYSARLTSAMLCDAVMLHRVRAEDSWYWPAEQKIVLVFLSGCCGTSPFFSSPEPHDTSLFT